MRWKSFVPWGSWWRGTPAWCVALSSTWSPTAVGEAGAAEDRNQEGQEGDRPSRAGYASPLFQGCLLRVDASVRGCARHGPEAMGIDGVLQQVQNLCERHFLSLFKTG